MTLPDNDFKTVIEAIQRLRRKYHIPRISMAMDAGISDAHFYKILEYGFVPPEDSEVREKLYKLIEKLKIQYPEDCPQEVKPK